MWWKIGIGFGLFNNSRLNHNEIFNMILILVTSVFQYIPKSTTTLLRNKIENDKRCALALQCHACVLELDCMQQWATMEDFNRCLSIFNNVLTNEKLTDILYLLSPQSCTIWRNFYYFIPTQVSASECLAYCLKITLRLHTQYYDFNKSTIK